MEPAPVKRDAAWVEREYNREKWPAVDRAVEEISRSEPNPRLDRVLARVARSQWEGPDLMTDREHVFGGRTVETPTVVAFGGQSAMVSELVVSQCTEHTDLVVELGAGWAWHLLSVWLRGGPAGATYAAAEYTEAGRQAAERLAALDPDLEFRAIAFDYHNPVLEGLPKARHAVVFTQHSIEQIPQVRPELFAAICGLADEVTCIHFEPIGWQAGEPDRAGSSGDYAEQHDYNRNLLTALREEEAAGRLTVEMVRPEIVGVNPRNATSVVLWRA